MLKLSSLLPLALPPALQLKRLMQLKHHTVPAKPVLTLFLAALLTASGSSPALAIKASPEPLQGSNVAVAYQLPGSEVVHGVNQEIYFHPASTQKLITALAATLFLGEDFTFDTRLQLQRKALLNPPAEPGAGASAADSAASSAQTAASASAAKGEKLQLKLDPDGTLHSNVTVKFSADPTLTINSYRKLLANLQKYGVKRIDGNVLLDISRVGTPIRAQGWNWSDIPACFTAPASAVILGRNCTFIQLENSGPGTIARPKIPAGLPLTVKSDAVAVANRDYGGDCELEVNLYQGNSYHLDGCIPADNNGKPFPLSLDVADPVAWGVSWTEKILNGLGITVTGEIRPERTPANDSVDLARVKSPALGQMVEYMLMHSNNLYADAIAKNTAYEYYSLPATYNRTARALRSILNQYADINLSHAYIVDGSGLSAHNLLTASELLEVLTYIKNHDDKLHLIDKLPVSGKKGTLHWRASTINPPLKLNVIAKTGTLQNVSNLAGYVRSKSGKLIPFVMFTNAITYTERTRDLVKFRRMASPHLNYERYVLEHIYNEEVMGRDF